MKIVKRPLAETDLDDLWWYIARDNPDAADRFLDKLEAGCRRLAQFPQTGLSRDELYPGLPQLSHRQLSDLLSACRRWH